MSTWGWSPPHRSPANWTTNGPLTKIYVTCMAPVNLLTLQPTISVRVRAFTATLQRVPRIGYAAALLAQACGLHCVAYKAQACSLQAVSERQERLPALWPIYACQLQHTGQLLPLRLRTCAQPAYDTCTAPPVKPGLVYLYSPSAAKPKPLGSANTFSSS